MLVGTVYLLCVHIHIIGWKNQKPLSDLLNTCVTWESTPDASESLLKLHTVTKQSSSDPSANLNLKLNKNLNHLLDLVS